MFKLIEDSPINLDLDAIQKEFDSLDEIYTQLTDLRNDVARLEKEIQKVTELLDSDIRAQRE